MEIYIIGSLICFIACLLGEPEEISNPRKDARFIFTCLIAAAFWPIVFGVVVNFVWNKCNKK